MTTRLADRSRKRAAARPSLDALVRQLVSEATTSQPSSEPISVHEAVLLDTEVDGVRIVLTKPPPPPVESQSAARAIQLSPREREITRMVAEGHSNKLIASVLDISLWTVSTHLRRIFAKLGVTTRAGMVGRAMTDGLISGGGRSRGRDGV